MPHIIVKLLAGRSEEQKAQIAADVAAALINAAACPASAVSVRLEEVASDRWMEDVFQPDIAGGAGTLYKKPGYGPKLEDAP